MRNGSAERQTAHGAVREQGQGVLLPLGLMLLAAGLSLALWARLVDEGRARLYDTVTRTAEAVSAGLIAGERLRLEALQRMVSRWEDGYLGGMAEWEKDARRYIDHFSNLELLAVVDRDGRYLGAVGSAAPADDAHFTADATRAASLSQATETGTPQFGTLTADASGVVRAVAVLPLRRGGTDVGYLVALVDVTGYFADALGHMVPAFGLVATGPEGILLFARDGEGGPARDQRSRVTLRVPLRWSAVDLSVEPGATHESYFTGGAVHLVLGLGLLCALSAGVIGLLWWYGRRQAHELQAAHQRLQELFDNAVVMICSFDADGRFRMVNAASRAVLGYAPEELIGTHFAPLIHEEDLPRAEQEAQKVFGGGQTTDYELRFRRKDGAIVDLSWSSYWSSRDHLVYGVARDVTARKRRDLLLAGQQRALADIVRGLPARQTMDVLSALVQQLVQDARTSVMRLEGGRLHTVASRGLAPEWNRAMDGLPIGPDAGVCGVVALTGEPRVVPDVSLDPNCAAYGGLAAAHGIQACWSVPLLGGDGAVLGTFALYFATPRTPEGEELELLAGAAQVASLAFERERLDAILQRTARRLHDAAHVARLGHWELDIGSGVLHWSDEVYDIFGLTHAEFGADYGSFLQRVHPDDRAQLQAAQDVVLAGGPVLDVAHRILRDDGAVRWVHERALLERDGDGRPVSLVGTAQDVTSVVNLRHALEEARSAALAESQRLNAELEERVAARTAELESANKELETFAYSVSHDLRAPLRAIAGFSDILLREHQEQLDEQGRRFLQRVVAGTQRMGRLIDDLLDLSRVSRLAPERRPVDLSALAERLLQERAEHEPERQVEWQVEPGLTVDADPRLLEIALDNLLGNAWKFTRDRRPAHISVRQDTASDGTLVYVVQDDGAGFDPRYADRLFGVFQRLHNDSEFPGTGIGLATVQRVIHRHGGRVWAEGQLDAGCTIRFTLG